jgi:hypothetical protein
MLGAGRRGRTSIHGQDANVACVSGIWVHRCDIPASQGLCRTGKAAGRYRDGAGIEKLVEYGINGIIIALKYQAGADPGSIFTQYIT